MTGQIWCGGHLPIADLDLVFHREPKVVHPRRGERQGTEDTPILRVGRLAREHLHAQHARHEHK